MWLFIKNVIAFLLGLVLVPVAAVVISSGLAAILGQVRPSWEFEWSRFSTNGKLLIGAGFDAAFLYLAYRLFCRSRKYIAMGVVCGAIVDFVIRYKLEP